MQKLLFWQMLAPPGCHLRLCGEEAAMLEAHKRSLCRPETGSWASAFAYCRGKCRTSSHSTVHENAYLDTQHHCFSPSGKLPVKEQLCSAFKLIPVQY